MTRSPPDVFALITYTRNDAGHLCSVHRTKEDAERAAASLLRRYRLPGFYLAEVQQMKFGEDGGEIDATWRLAEDGGAIEKTMCPEDYRWPSKEAFEAALESKRQDALTEIPKARGGWGE